jgi:hypothetical protein
LERIKRLVRLVGFCNLRVHTDKNREEEEDEEDSDLPDSYCYTQYILIS